MEDFLDACQSELGAQVEGYLGPVAMKTCPASVIPCPLAPLPPAELPGGSLADAAPTTTQAPEERLEGMDVSDTSIWLWRAYNSQAGVPEDEGTSPFQPPLDIVSTNNGANKEPFLLT